MIQPNSRSVQCACRLGGYRPFRSVVANGFTNKHSKCWRSNRIVLSGRRFREVREQGVNASPEDAQSSSEFESLSIDDEGMLILVWPRGVTITGPAARHAMDEVNRICGDTRRPMLVDMATTKSVAREARVVFGERCAASRIAMLGRSPVDRVIANFALGRIPPRPPCPTKFFTDRDQAYAFLREGMNDRNV